VRIQIQKRLELESIKGFKNIKDQLKNPVVCIGNFDGVHLGHAGIAGTAVRRAREFGGVAVALTFRPHPRAVLGAGAEPCLLTTYDERNALLAAQGIDVVVEEPFGRELSEMAYEDFFGVVLKEKIGARRIVVGYDFAFGRGRGGHLGELESLCARAGAGLEIVQARHEDGAAVSSTRIRKLLAAGDVQSGARLLGREFFYKGIVIKGEGRGRQLGFPTANLLISEGKLALPQGVYATKTVLSGEQPCLSATYIGARPTFEGKTVVVETHLLDRDIDLYGSLIEVRFVRHIRGEQKFDGMEALKRQIAVDISQSRT